MDQLHDVVLVDHLARCHCEVAADSEGGTVGELGVQAAVAPDKVIHHVLRALGEIGALCIDSGTYHLGVKQGKVCRRERVRHLPQVEFDPSPGFVVESTQLLDQVAGMRDRRKIALLDRVERRTVGPLGILETLVVVGRAATCLAGLPCALNEKFSRRLIWSVQ